MEKNHFSAAASRYSIAAGIMIAVSMLLGCSDSNSKKKTVPVTILEFLRGDSNNDGKVDISDGISLPGDRPRRHR
jgi:hypothetical protein